MYPRHQMHKSVKQNADREKLRTATIRLPPELWEEARILAIRRRITLGTVCSEALERYIADAEATIGTAA